jgi:hypothetical protein
MRYFVTPKYLKKRFDHTLILITARLLEFHYMDVLHDYI